MEGIHMAINLKQVYHSQFFHVRLKLAWRIPYVCNGLYEVFRPRSVVDVGCAIGEYVHYFAHKKGIVAKGIEGSPRAKDFMAKDTDVEFLDLRKPRLYFGRFDLAICLEVAEHIEPEFSGIFVDNLSWLSDIIVLTAAPPGQEGYGHVNCQPQTYWVKKFDSIGYNLAEGYIMKLKRQWEQIAKDRKEMRMYYNNLMVFRREVSNG
jgi:SAM-dependent methyltransferase